MLIENIRIAKCIDPEEGKGRKNRSKKLLRKRFSKIVSKSAKKNG